MIIHFCHICTSDLLLIVLDHIFRYESTITGQFFGHTHNMIYEVFYDVINRTRPVGVAYIPGSVTTYSFLNPGFRIYEVDGNYEGSSWVSLVSGS